jgi:hypothetical protein
MTQLNFLDTPKLLEELSESQPKEEIIDFLDVEEDVFDRWKSGKLRLSEQHKRALLYYCMNKGLEDILEYYVSGLRKARL